MANKGYTAPKGRPTSGRDGDEQRSRRIPPMLEWTLLAIVILTIVVAAWIFSSGDTGSSPHSGAPSVAVVAEIEPTSTG